MIRKFSSKDIGVIQEVEFAFECIRRGAYVSQPIGANSPYNFLVDNGVKILRVQVKTASLAQKKYNGWNVNLARCVPNLKPGSGPSSRTVKYAHSDIDIIVAKADDAWFFFENIDQLPITALVYPDRDKGEGKWNYTKNDWAILGL